VAGIKWTLFFSYYYTDCHQTPPFWRGVLVACLLDCMIFKLALRFILPADEMWLAHTCGWQCNFFVGTGVWIQGFGLARQVVYHLNSAFSPLWSGFGVKALLFPRPAWTMILLFYTSCVTGMTTVPNFFHWDGVSQLFLPGLAWNLNPPSVFSMPGYRLRWRLLKLSPPDLNLPRT
jgi:hypothetical protein